MGHRGGDEEARALIDRIEKQPRHEKIAALKAALADRERPVLGRAGLAAQLCSARCRLAGRGTTQPVCLRVPRTHTNVRMARRDCAADFNRRPSSVVTRDLQNRIARELLDRFLAFSKEFGNLKTQIGPDELNVSASDLSVVVDRMVAAGLAKRHGDACAATTNALSVAADPTKAGSMFPVEEGFLDSLPWEADHAGRPFERVTNPPPAMAWDAYLDHLGLVWPAVLNSDQQGQEDVFQRFLEKHPCLLPHPYSCFQRGATIYARGVITQPELPGFRAKRPDFMVLGYDSEAVVPLLIEIEAPAKPWSNNSGFSSAKFTQARDQLVEWKTWFREPENILQFCRLYGIDDRTRETRQLLPRYAPIFGRRQEVESRPGFAKKRALLASSDEVFMTYDRLSASSRLGGLPTLRLSRAHVETTTEVVSVPPTLRLGPHTAREFSTWVGLREAVEANALIATERKAFLRDRLDYWDDWIRTPVRRDAGGPRLQDGYSE